MSLEIGNTRLIAADTSLSNCSLDKTNTIVLLEQTSIEKVVIEFAFDVFRLVDVLSKVNEARRIKITIV